MLWSSSEYVFNGRWLYHSEYVGSSCQEKILDADATTDVDLRAIWLRSSAIPLVNRVDSENLPGRVSPSLTNPCASLLKLCAQGKRTSFPPEERTVFGQGYTSSCTPLLEPPNMLSDTMTDVTASRAGLHQTSPSPWSPCCWGASFPHLSPNPFTMASPPAASVFRTQSSPSRTREDETGIPEEGTHPSKPLFCRVVRGCSTISHVFTGLLWPYLEIWTASSKNCFYGKLCSKCLTTDLEMNYWNAACLGTVCRSTLTTRGPWKKEMTFILLFLKPTTHTFPHLFLEDTNKGYLK